MRTAIRDAVNRHSRKPFYWGGLKGYEQLEAISQVLQDVPSDEPETTYLRRLTMQVNRAVHKNRVLAQDLREAHTWLRHIAACLRYPSSSFAATDETLTSAQVRQEMEALLQTFRPDFKRSPAQTALYSAWHRVWETCGFDLLHCYDIPGLPPDNLQLEAFFGQLRCHQRRVSGRKSTRELRDFGQFQVLFLATSEQDLFEQLRQVPLSDYHVHRRRLAEAEVPRQFLRRLHRNPLRTVRSLLDQHTARRVAFAAPSTSLSPP